VTENTVSSERKEMILLGVASGFAFNYWWWEAWLGGLLVANWIAVTWQVGDAKLKVPKDG
jgi:hypothetical protein